MDTGKEVNKLTHVIYVSIWRHTECFSVEMKNVSTFGYISRRQFRFVTLHIKPIKMVNVSVCKGSRQIIKSWHKYCVI